MSLEDLKTQIDTLIETLECNVCQEGSTIENLKCCIKTEAEVTSDLITEVEDLKDRVESLEE